MAAPTDGAETVLAERVHNRDANKGRKHKNDVFKKCKYLPELGYVAFPFCSNVVCTHFSIHDDLEEMTPVLSE